MPNLLRSAICAAAFIAAPALTAHGALAQTPSSVATPTETLDIPYTSDVTGSYSADLYTPAGTGPFPAIVMIHGGSWRSGRKSELRRLSQDLAAKGYVCFSIDYDTHPRSFPYSWQESRDAVSFLRAHAQQYHVDPQRIAALGTSAGGQLAALLAVAPRGPAPTSAIAVPVPNPIPSAVPDAPPLPDIPIQAAVLFNGGYDAHPSAWVLRRYLGGRCSKIPLICNDASPDSHVAPGDPPIFVGHGTHDGVIPYSQATGFIALLRQANDPVTPFIATGAGHSYWRSRKWYTPNLDAAELFLKNSLSTPSTASLK